MANPEHLKILKQGVRVWNEWREDNFNIVPDLTKAVLEEYYLREANFSRSKLTGACFIDANLIMANFIDANLRFADLRRADLGNAYFRGADLTEAHMGDANLCWADFREADLSNAVFMETILGNTNLNKTKNLESIQHWGPSNVDHRTLEISGDLPLEFLRGCGLSDWQIEAAKLNKPDLTPTEISEIVYNIDKLRSENPIQIHNLFISYSHYDTEFVEKIEKHLKEKNILYWRDVHDAPAGPLEKIVIRAIRQNPIVLLVFSKKSVESDWVEYEAEKARELEKELNRHVLCPIALDDSWKTCNWSAVLRNQIKKYNILDFSKWEDETDFEDKFNRLLKGLDLFYKKE